MKNRSETYPIKDIAYQGIHFKSTDFGPLVDVLDSINEGSNIWVNMEGRPMKEGMAIYSKELLPGILVIAFDTAEARNEQFKANESLEGRDTGKYTVPDITTFFEIEKGGGKIYCYLVDRIDMWKHRKEMPLGEKDAISIDGIVVYPSGLISSYTGVSKTSTVVSML